MFRRKDAILVGALVAIGLVIALVYIFAGASAGMAVVKLDGRVVAELDLGQNGSYTYGDDENYNVVTVADGTVAVTDATCKDKLCVHMGRISRPGQSIVCLPHKLVVSIEKGTSTGVDAVSQ